MFWLLRRLFHSSFVRHSGKECRLWKTCKTCFIRILYGPIWPWATDCGLSFPIFKTRTVVKITWVNVGNLLSALTSSWCYKQSVGRWCKWWEEQEQQKEGTGDWEQRPALSHPLLQSGSQGSAVRPASVSNDWTWISFSWLSPVSTTLPALDKVKHY